MSLRQRLKSLRRFVYNVLLYIPVLRAIPETENTFIHMTVSSFILQQLGRNRGVPWPVHHRSLVTGSQYITIGKNTAPGISFGNYIFASKDSPVAFGDYTVLAPNVCVAGFNHDPENISQYASRGGVKIGSYCWIGVNSVVLPGVVLGDHTVVAAGAVVTRSFQDGYCIVGGNPAREIKKLDPDKVSKFTFAYEYVGYRRLGKVHHD
ncbi:acyltransferase [Mariprofundus erugo]|uniref:acyltransferase n=1 Tax=Mariprofundus erugo TaxID=2528639 RepID=UPI0010FEF251|nr:acyltransferase [Mariprofundus erugo]TLS76036.1 acyltransferase [Mariprofundus erugo]